jgi:hypothetical protein
MRHSQIPPSLPPSTPLRTMSLSNRLQKVTPLRDLLKRGQGRFLHLRQYVFRNHPMSVVV